MDYFYSKFKIYCDIVVKRFGIRRSDAEDIVQQAIIVFCRVYGNEASEWSEAQIWSVFKKILRSQSMDWKRRQSTENRYKEIYKNHVSPNEDMSVDWLLALCPLKYRDIIEKFYLENYSYTDLCKQYCKSRDTMKKWLRRAKNSMRKSLQKIDELLKLENGKE